MKAGLAREAAAVLGSEIEVRDAFVAYRGPRLESGGALVPALAGVLFLPILRWSVPVGIVAVVGAMIGADPLVSRFRRWFVIATTDDDVVVLAAGRGNNLGTPRSIVERHPRTAVGPVLHEVDREVYIGGRNYWVPDEYVDAARAARLRSHPA